MAIKNHDNIFPSETFTCLTMARAMIIIGGKYCLENISRTFLCTKNTQRDLYPGPEEIPCTTSEFLTLPMDGKVILRMEMVPFDSDFIFAGYKIMPRAVVRCSSVSFCT